MESCEYMSSLHGGNKTSVLLLKKRIWIFLNKYIHSREVKFEVELPRCRAGRIISIFVHEREAELDDLQEVDVAPEQLVLVVHCAAELADGPNHHSRKLCVLIKTNNQTVETEELNILNPYDCVESIQNCGSYNVISGSILV